MKQKMQAVKKECKDKLHQLPKECSFCNNIIMRTNMNMTYE